MIQIKTGRGIYEIKNAAPVERSSDSIVLTLSLERADGIEKIALKCKISASLIQQDQLEAPEKLAERLAPWIEREFEMTREAALKTIRSERRLLEIVFDSANRGPFTW